MSTRISETMIQFGSLDKRHFSKSSKAGAWEHFTVNFPASFPQVGLLPSVIVTPSDHGLSGFTASQLIPAVGIVVDVSVSGFTLAARNSAPRAGLAGFNWMAVLETPGTQQRAVEVRMGVTQPKHFQTGPFVAPVTSMTSSGGARDWYIDYPAFNHEETVFLTATNLYGTERRNAAIVGMAVEPHVSGFWILGESADRAAGDCGFYFAALAEGEQGVGQDLWVERGGTESMKLGPWGKKLAWGSEEVTFRDPFMTPPIVLVTAASPRWGKYRSVPALGIARYVTTHGFTLAARNTTKLPGSVWFSWVAFGCSRYCAWGQGSRG